MTKTTVNYHLTDTTITLTYAGKIRTVNRDTDMGKEVLELIRNNKLEDIPELIDVSIKISKIDPKKRFEVIDGEVYCHGIAVPETLSNKILTFMKEKLPIEIFLRFWENLKKNPSKASQEQLFGFLENSHFPFTPDGCFIAYKSVRNDFKDSHSGKFDNSPGKKVTMDRSKVVDNPNITCAAGLHIASYNYAKKVHNDSVLIEVKVNPKDVVSVPTDYNQAKCRTCAYEVIGTIESEHQVTVAPKKVPTTKSAKKAAKAKPTEKVDTKDGTLVLPSHLEMLQIGPYTYKSKAISMEEYAKKTDNKKYNRVRPSKYPASIKTIKPSEVFRRMITKTKYEYYIHINGVFINMTQVKSK